MDVLKLNSSLLTAIEWPPPQRTCFTPCKNLIGIRSVAGISLSRLATSADKSHRNVVIELAEGGYRLLEPVSRTEGSSTCNQPVESSLYSVARVRLPRTKLRQCRHGLWNARDATVCILAAKQLCFF
jgi:hypothetical protein